jgi:hypothetical protein
MKIMKLIIKMTQSSYSKSKVFGVGESKRGVVEVHILSPPTTKH